MANTFDLLDEYDEMEVIQDFIEQENSLMLLGFIDDELVSKSGVVYGAMP